MDRCSCIFVVAFTFLSFGNVLSAPSKSPIVPITGQICKDGKGPLLEGEDSPFPCADECPDGFMCEHPIEGEPLGICCPNLDILYDLYGKNSAEVVVEDLPTLPTTTTTLSTKEVREVSKFASSWQETSEVPEIFTEALPLIDNNNEDDDKKDTPSPDSHLLKYLKAKELRLSQEKLPIHRSFPMSDPYSNPINPLNPANVPTEKEEKNEIIPTNSNKNKTESIKPNCKRQKYERSCEKGEKKTQIVLRWFAKNGECCSYPYGYCQGTLVKDDITLRTKEECEIFCLSNATQISSSFETENSPFEMEINNNQVSTSSHSESVMNSEVDNSTVVDSKLDSKTKAESVEDFVTPPPLTTVSFTDLVLNNNFSTTASFIDLVKSNISAASTTASFIELVLHNNSGVALSDVKMDSKIDSVTKSESLPSTETPVSLTTVTQESSAKVTPESSTIVTPAKVNDEKSSTVIQNSYPKNEPVQGSKIPISTPPTPTPSPVNIINSESSYLNSDSQTSVNNNPASPQKLQFEPLPPTPSPLFPTLANPIQGDVEGGSGTNELEEVFPPGYGPEIDENNQTRVILHSDIPEPISIAPPTDESDAHAKELISEMSESDTSKNNEVVATKNDSSSKKEVLQQEKMEQQKSMNELKTETEEATKNIQNENELKVLIKKPLPEFKRTLTPEKVEPKKSCLKVLPYRAMCPSGMPSQFTLRWFVKAGMCCAYPFGYCHGELVFNEEAIKTKKECEELCLGKIDSEKPYHLF